jgi:hypothetical protein
MSGPNLYRLPAARGNTAAGIYLGAVGCVFGVVVLSIWATTQLVAYRLSFHPALGTPLVTIASPSRASCHDGRDARRWWTSDAELAGLGGDALHRCRGPARTAGRAAVRAAELLHLVGRFGDVPGTADVWRHGAWLVSVPSHAALFLAIVVAVRRTGVVVEMIFVE